MDDISHLSVLKVLASGMWVPFSAAMGSGPAFHWFRALREITVNQRCEKVTQKAKRHQILPRVPLIYQLIQRSIYDLNMSILPYTSIYEI